MSTKRRDNRNRILRNGESQRSDGRYIFKYTDPSGHIQYVYSWKLEPTDRTPAGKRNDLSLREKEKQIQKDLDDNILPRGGDMTVAELVEKYSSKKQASVTTLPLITSLYLISSRKTPLVNGALIASGSLMQKNG